MSESVHAPRLARGLESERVWALEDREHVSGSFERFLLAHGERVVRVATRSMAGERSADCDRGKSDHIDALAVARAALREGIERSPVGPRRGGEDPGPDDRTWSGRLQPERLAVPPRSWRGTRRCGRHLSRPRAGCACGARLTSAFTSPASLRRALGARLVCPIAAARQLGPDAERLAAAFTSRVLGEAPAGARL
jgi:hypothetical protein